jgi:beta-glucosidase
VNWPDGFIWGTGASSSQTEGAAPASDAIDRERAGHMPVSGTGNDFGTRYAEDFALYASLGLTHHRLSIEWARIEPAEGERDPAALGHYRNMLEAAHNSGVVPWICLHHFTLPRWFSDAGGFAVEENRAKYWTRHVEFMAEAFGDLAGGWKPINEVNYYGSISGSPAMGSGFSREQQRTVDTQIHLANAEAAATFRQTGKPVCSIFGLSYAVALDDHPDTLAACEKYYRNNWDRGLALYRDGVLTTRDGEVIERPDLQGCFDYIGFSYYSCFAFREGQFIGVYPEDTPRSPLGYGIWADGLGLVLDRLHDEVPGAPLIVSEYGVGTDDDHQRADYVTRGLEMAHAAIGRGVDVRGFFSWTGVDNYEWTHGYDVKFGIIDADRKPKPFSAPVFAREARP